MNKNYNLSKLFKILSVLEVLSFGKGQRNRQISHKHVNDFVNVIKNGKSKFYLDDGTYLVFGIIPIIINPLTGHILEGQHRLEAFKKAYQAGLIDENARILVAYWPIEDEEVENALIIELNSKTKNWTLEDYLNSYSQYLEYYKKLREFCEGHELCINYKNGVRTFKYRYAAAMLTGKYQATSLRSGKFQFTDEEMKLGDTIHNEMVTIRKKLKFIMSGNDVEAMAAVWYSYRNKISANDIKKLSYIPKGLKDNKKFTKKEDWEQVFSRLRDIIEDSNLKNKAA